MAGPTPCYQSPAPGGTAWAAASLAACWVLLGGMGHACPVERLPLRGAALLLASLASIPAVVLLVLEACRRSARAAVWLGCVLLALQQLLGAGLTAEGAIAWAVVVAAYLGYLRAFGLDDMVEGTIFGAAAGAAGAAVVALHAHVQMVAAMRATMPH